jgi:hypothetical protein
MGAMSTSIDGRQVEKVISRQDEHYEQDLIEIAGLILILSILFILSATTAPRFAEIA